MLKHNQRENVDLQGRIKNRRTKCQVSVRRGGSKGIGKKLISI